LETIGLIGVDQFCVCMKLGEKKKSHDACRGFFSNKELNEA